MLKFLLRRLAGRARPTPEPEALPAAPLTMLAVELDEDFVELIDVDNLFFPWLLEMGAAAPQAINETEDRLLRALKRLADDEDATVVKLLPRMPAVLPMLLRSLRDPDVSSHALAAQIAQDPALVTAVLRQVNSSYYRRAVPARTIEDAVSVLGQNGLRMLVARVAFTPLFNTQLGRLTAVGVPRVWELTEPFGVACACFAKARAIDGFEAYLAGLLRHIGVIVALRAADQAGGAAAGELRSLDFVGSFIHYSGRLAYLVGRQWEFPEGVMAAAARATGGAPGQAAKPETDTATALARTVQLADRTSKIRLLAKHGLLAPEHVDACLEREEAVVCYREILATEAWRSEHDPAS